MKHQKTLVAFTLAFAGLFNLAAQAEITSNVSPFGLCHTTDTDSASATVTINGSSGTAVPSTVTISRCYYNPFDYSAFIANLNVSGGGVFHNGLGPLAGTGVGFTSSGPDRSYFKTYNFAANPAITVKWFDPAGINKLQSGTSFFATNSNGQSFTLTIN